MAYTPTPNLYGSFDHMVDVEYYTREAMDTLDPMNRFRAVCDKHALPLHSGKKIRFWRWGSMTTQTGTTTEGAVGTSLASPLTPKLVVTLSAYANYLTISDQAEEYGFDSILSGCSQRLGVMAGIALDTVTRTTIDAESASTNLPLLGPVFASKDILNGWTQLAAVNVKEKMEDDLFHIVMHPFAFFDIISDPASNAHSDLWKYTDPTRSGAVRIPDRGNVTTIHGCKVIMSTNVLVQSGPTRYRAYLVGRGAIGCVDLEGKGPSDVVDPANQRFRINLRRPEMSTADPEGKIAGFASYNFKSATFVKEGPAGIGGVYRYRTFDVTPTVAA